MLEGIKSSTNERVAAFSNWHIPVPYLQDTAQLVLVIGDVGSIVDDQLPLNTQRENEVSEPGDVGDATRMSP